LLLQHLKAIATAARPYGPQVMFYLAAAVSDFYIPWSHLVWGGVSAITAQLMSQLLQPVASCLCLASSHILEPDHHLLLVMIQQFAQSWPP
jgi:hypothetical protein